MSRQKSSSSSTSGRKRNDDEALSKILEEEENLEENPRDDKPKSFSEKRNPSDGKEKSEKSGHSSYDNNYPSNSSYSQDGTYDYYSDRSSYPPPPPYPERQSSRSHYPFPERSYNSSRSYPDDKIESSTSFRYSPTERSYSSGSLKYERLEKEKEDSGKDKTLDKDRSSRYDKSRYDRDDHFEKDDSFYDKDRYKSRKRSRSRSPRGSSPYKREKSNEFEEPCPNVFINYLPYEFVEEDLKKLFIQFGDIKSIKIMLDLRTGQSRGFGFVRFYEWTSADQAIKEMNGKIVGNKPLLVKYAENSGVPNASGVRSENVFIKGLPYSFNDKDLYNLASAYGRIIHVKILRDPRTFNSRGQAFVRYERLQDAERAIRELNGYDLPHFHQVLSVRFADADEEKIHYNDRLHRSPRRSPHRSPRRSPRQSPRRSPHHSRSASPVVHHSSINTSAPASEASFVLYVNDLPLNSDETLLYRLFAPFGAILNVSFPYDSESKKRKGYAMIQMSSFKDAESAMKALDGKKVEGKVLHISFKK